MKFVNEISVQSPADELFAFLSDVERVAPCLPGASIAGRDGDDYRGSMKVKIGPITGVYEGTLRFLERDENRRRAVLSARADEAAGQGHAEARIETEIAEADDGSQLRMVTDLQLQGRVAQFGRGAIERISQRMFSEFARNIEQRLAGGADGANGAALERDAEDEAKAPAAGASKQAQDDGDDGELDALRLIGGSLLERIGPLLLSALIGFGYGYLLGRLRELTR
jgi:carbon monoxide dehydrogenase subunit G